MILTSRPKIRNIESALQQLQEDITSLYNQSNQAVSNKTDNQTSAKEKLRFVETANTQTTRNLYVSLSVSWERYGIKLPPYQKIAPKLSRAVQVLKHATEHSPELHGKLNVVLVPPLKVLSFPLLTSMRSAQGLPADLVIDNLPKSAKGAQRQWKVVVAYTGEQGLYLGTPKDILFDKSYMIAGFNTLKLGYREYAALSLQQSKPIDQKTWTVLLGDYQEDSPFVPCAGFINGQYRFELIEIDTVFGNDRFRPAIEVT